MKNFPRVLSNSLLYLETRNVNSTHFGTLEILHRPYKLKKMLNTTAAVFMEVIVHVMETMLLNP